MRRWHRKDLAGSQESRAARKRRQESSPIGNCRLCTGQHGRACSPLFRKLVPSAAAKRTDPGCTARRGRRAACPDSTARRCWRRRRTCRPGTPAWCIRQRAVGVHRPGRRVAAARLRTGHPDRRGQRCRDLASRLWFPHRGSRPPPAESRIGPLGSWTTGRLWRQQYKAHHRCPVGTDRRERRRLHRRFPKLRRRFRLGPPGQHWSGRRSGQRSGQRPHRRSARAVRRVARPLHRQALVPQRRATLGACRSNAVAYG